MDRVGDRDGRDGPDRLEADIDAPQDDDGVVSALLDDRSHSRLHRDRQVVEQRRVTGRRHVVGVHAGVDLDSDPVELAGCAEHVENLVVVRLLVGLEVIPGPAIGGNQYQPHVKTPRVTR